MSDNKRRKNRLNENLKKEFPFIVVKNRNDDSLVKCTICNREFSIAIHGRSAITAHIETKVHKTSHDTAASTSKLTTFFKGNTFGTSERKLAVMEGTFAFHTIIHNHSFRSMDCTNKLLKKFCDEKFSCARTKCESIVTSVFNEYCKKMLSENLDSVSYISILSDASNHNEIKLYPILVRYFDSKNGIQIKILNLESIEGETSDILSNHLFRVMTDNNLNKKILALSADNTNTNFGGRTRKGVNNVYTKLQDLLKRNILGIGCNAHIISNAINTASSSMSIDVEVIITNIYLYFNRFTVRVANLKEFCKEAGIQYKKLLGYYKVRWLALTPALERVLQLYDPLRSYFLSLDKCPTILKKFFQNDMSEPMLYFIHSQASLFHKTTLQIEGDKISAAEVCIILNDFALQCKSRFNDGFLPLILKNKLTVLEESNPGIKNKFLKEVKNFYKICYEYIEEWIVNFKALNCFKWTLLNSKIEWKEVSLAVEFVMQEVKDIVINDNFLFEEIRRVNLYLNEEKLKKWNDEKIELDKRWVDIFRHFREEHIPHENLKVLIEISLCCPGTNAAVERVFSLGNDYWSSEKSQLSVKTLSAVLTVKFNMQNESCSEVATLLEEHPHLAKKIHSEEKYVFKKK